MLHSLKIGLIVIGLGIAGAAFAAGSSGTIDPLRHYAWGENIGWVDFADPASDVVVNDFSLTGAAWSETLGWIVLNCSTTDTCDDVDYGVTNDGEGNLSGVAWSENGGWIDFHPTHGSVSIDANGVFSGGAWGENLGWIIFNCSTTDSCGAVSYFVKTDWRRQSIRAACDNGIDDDFDGLVDYPEDPGCSSANDTTEIPTIIPPDDDPDPGDDDEDEDDNDNGGNSSTTPTSSSSGSSGGGSGGGGIILPANPFQGAYIVANDGIPVTDNPQLALALYGGPGAVSMIVSSDSIMNEAPISITSSLPWHVCQGFSLCPSGLYRIYVQYLDAAGNRSAILSAYVTLTESSYTPPEVRTVTPLDQGSSGSGNGSGSSLGGSISGSGASNRNSSSGGSYDAAGGVVRLQSNGNLIDHEVSVPLNRSHIMHADSLIMMPESTLEVSFGSENVDVGSVSGHIAKKSEDKKSKDAHETIHQVTFTRSSNQDSLHQASIRLPREPGDYRIILTIQHDPGQPESLVTLHIPATVAPHGYAFHRTRSGHERVRDAEVSLYTFDPRQGTFVLWHGESQENPKMTDREGYYSYRVPRGSYYIKVSSPGHHSFTTPVFFVPEAQGTINMPLELDRLSPVIPTFIWWVVVTIGGIIGVIAAGIRYRRWRLRKYYSRVARVKTTPAPRVGSIRNVSPKHKKESL